MPMPLWWGHINKRIFNPIALRNRKWPIIRHVGRTSGREYRTPLDAHAVDDDFIFILVYGSRSDWVQNVLAAGEATLESDGVEHRLTQPRLITKEAAWKLLPADTKPPPEFLNVSEYLQMTRAA